MAFELYLRMSEREWKRALKSNKPLFKRIFSPAEARAMFIGPRATPTGIVGDIAVIETMKFELKAIPEQSKFYEELLEHNHIRALEYLLTITSAIDIWKEDIKRMIHFYKSSIRGIKNLKHLRALVDEDIYKAEGVRRSLENDANEILKIDAAIKRFIEREKKEEPFLFK